MWLCFWFRLMYLFIETKTQKYVWIVEMRKYIVQRNKIIIIEMRRETTWVRDSCSFYDLNTLLENIWLVYFLISPIHCVLRLAGLTHRKRVQMHRSCININGGHIFHLELPLLCVQLDLAQTAITYVPENSSNIKEIHFETYSAGNRIVRIPVTCF
jgi:hypothetical protein